MAHVAARSTARPLRQNYPYYIGRKAVTHAQKTIPVVDKYTHKVATHVSAAPKSVIHDAFKLAAHSEEKMKALPSYARRDIINQIVDGIKKREIELAEAITIEVGKPLKDSKVELARAMDTLTVSAEEAVRPFGEFKKLDMSSRNHGFQSIISRFPAGTVSMIVPFNFPINLAVHKIGPAIAAGCPFVLKPSDRTPLSASILGEILSETSLPEGAASILPCELADAPVFSTDPHIKVLSFTGSAALGWKLKQNSGKMKVLLELGGNAACIVDETADPEKAAQRIVFGAFFSQGQSCISVQRVYIHEKVYDSMVNKIVAGAAALKAGDPFDPETFVGPVISENDAIRLEKWIHTAVSGGAKLLTGGQRDGALLNATVLENVPRSNELSFQEAFGPVCVIEKFKDFKEVCKAVNDSAFGLQAGIFTSDINRAFYAYNALDVGGVVINDIPSVRVDAMPYGGIKDSGFGREGVRYAIEEMSELKILLLKDIGNL